MIEGTLFINKKNGQTYTVIDKAKDVTDGGNGSFMIVYLDRFGVLYVREEGNFMEKFEPCD